MAGIWEAVPGLLRCYTLQKAAHQDYKTGVEPQCKALAVPFISGRHQQQLLSEQLAAKLCTGVAAGELCRRSQLENSLWLHAQFVL